MSGHVLAAGGARALLDYTVRDGYVLLGFVAFFHGDAITTAPAKYENNNNDSDPGCIAIFDQSPVGSVSGKDEPIQFNS